MTSRITEDQPVLVLGGGIGGLNTALQLHRVGIPCRVVEAAPEFAPIGLGINVLPHASRELTRLRLEGELSGLAVVTEEAAFYNRSGQLIYREPAGRQAGYPYPQYSIHRGDLHEVLATAIRERIGDEALVLGQKVVRFEQSDDGVTVIAQSADGAESEFRGAVVVGADGIHSVVRRQLFPHEGPARYSGVMLWRGSTVWPRLLSGATMVRAGWLAGGKLVAYPIRDLPDGRQLINWAAEIEMPQRESNGWTDRGLLDDFLPYYQDWTFDWLDVPAMMSAAESVLEYPMVDRDPLPRWSFDRVTLLGDAAHPMVPRGSNGAGQAILDARAVAESLAQHPNSPQTGLAEYERLRRPATSRVVLTNRDNPPDAILREVHQRTGDRPFSDINDVISQAEMKEISENYRKIAGFSVAELSE